MKEKEFKALVSLLDDSDYEVVKHVEAKILSLGDTVIPALEEEWGTNFNPVVQNRIEELIHTVQFGTLRDRLVAWKESDHQDLLEGMWILATYQYPDLEISELNEFLDSVYFEVESQIDKEQNPYDQVKALNSILFGKMKFGPNTKNFHSPGNSMINMVVQTKKGNPISLCAVYLLVAIRLELPIYGVNLPNLFVLTYKTSDTQFYINAFNRGLIFSRSDIENYVAQLNLSPLEQFFEPCSNVDIIIRSLRNLTVSFEKLGDNEKVDEIKELMNSLSDDNLKN